MNKLEHVAIIMDGNGRWATQRGLKRSDGHLAGVDRLRDIIDAAEKLDINYLTLYAFSTENFNRPEAEKNFLFKLIGKYFNAEINEFIRRGARIRFLGDKSLFSKPIQIILNKAEQMTKDNDKINVNFALGYGSRQEIIHAVNRMIKDGVEEVNDEVLSSYLYTSGMPDPDLLIRTSGEVRISNFLLYQIAYSELYFEKKYWPDFSAEDLKRIVDDYSNRKRRYGAL